MSTYGVWALWTCLFLLLACCSFAQTSRSKDVFSRYDNRLGLKQQKGHDSEKANTDIQVHQLKFRNRRSMTNFSTSTNGTTDAKHDRNRTEERSLPTPKYYTAPSPPEDMTAKVFVLPTAALEFFCPGEIHSCSSKCKNYTAHDTFSIHRNPSVSDCYCDRACNGVFQDCCSDYEHLCPTKSAEDSDIFYQHKTEWRCMKMDLHLKGGTSSSGTWMIARCPITWPDDNVKAKCHNPTSALDADSLLTFLPVVGLDDLLTYRNQYCALCNDVKIYEFWTLIFNENAVLPPYYTPDDLWKFITKNYQHLSGIQPKESQLIRWCTYPTVIANCPNSTSDQDMTDCAQGTVGLVTEDEQIFKNKACARCNGHRFPCGVPSKIVPPKSTHSSAISRAISLRDYGVSTTKESCRKNEVYDTFLKRCRQIYTIDELNSGNTDEYQVTMHALEKAPSFLFNGERLKESISLYFQVNQSLISDTEVTNQNIIQDLQKRIIFNIQLTQTQSLILASDSDLNGTSNETTSLRRLFQFKEAFQLEIYRQTYLIYRLSIRQLNCTRPYVYQHGEYVFLDDLRIRILSSGAIYQQYEYYINTTMKNASITVCLKILPPRCNGSFIKLNSSEFHFTNNLTLVYNSLMYSIGNYIYDNGKVFICVEFKREYSDVIHNKATKDELALVILTWLGFILSIIGLLVLFFTYVIFKELRTLPGKNLMNLCLSLCLAEILWLCGSTLDSYPTACTVVAIANHYFFIVFFTASSVIAFHSCMVFGRKSTFHRSPFTSNKIFIIFSVVAWGGPALFIFIFGLLDHYEVFITDYGRSVVCWLGTKDSKIYLFIVPFGILLLFNLTAFLLVAFRLRQHQKSSARAFGEEARKREARNVKICIKLSTLMGFSWLFGLLQVAVETETDVFAYLFIIFVSFQGLFICAAFLFQKKCYNLYNTLLTKSFNSSSRSNEGQDSHSSKKNHFRTQSTKL